jgi:formylglycine-generating enzyme required for sulfatase activity
VAPVGVLLLASLLIGAVIYLRSERDREVLELLGLTRILDRLMEQDLTDPAPARPEFLPDLQEWQRGVEAILGERQRMVAFLAEAGRFADTASGTTLREALQRAVSYLDEIDRPGGYLEAFEHRLEWAAQVEDLTVTRRADAWQTVLAELAADPRFEGLDFEPQIGLVPIGRDPASGLQEFALPVYGCAIPRRDSEGRLSIVGDTCPVFVLLPGGDFTVGSQGDDSEQPRYDPYREPFEPELREVHIEPLFAAKFEFTNGQWSALNPDAYLDPAYEFHGLTQPVVLATDLAIEHVLRAWGMRLPTDSEWEYLARAGSDAIWWCGDAPDELQGAVNLYDQSLLVDPGIKGEGLAAPWSDGFPLTAPVHTFRPNGFGLHHVLGNALEVVRVADPLPDESPYDIRGGSWHGGPAMCRITWRTSWFGEPKEAIGFRPVIDLQR